MLKVAIMLLSPPKYLFSIKIEISAIVLIQNGLEMDPFSVMLWLMELLFPDLPTMPYY